MDKKDGGIGRWGDGVKKPNEEMRGSGAEEKER